MSITMFEALSSMRENLQALPSTNWWVVTGGPSTGKTDLLSYIQFHYGHQIKVIPEAARVLIDQRRSQGQTTEEIRADEYKFQGDVAWMKFYSEQRSDPNELTLRERGYREDSFAYFLEMTSDENIPRPAWLDTTWGDVFTLVLNKRYKGVFLPDRLPYREDYARVEGEAKAARIHKLLGDVYRWFGYEPISIPVAPLDERARLIMDHIMAQS